MTEPLSLWGLGVALAGAPAVLLLARLFRFNAFSWAARLSLWAVGGLALALETARQGGLPAALEATGLASPSLSSLLWGLGTGAAIFLAMGVSMAGLRALGFQFGDQSRVADLVRLSWARRLFIITTAAVVEEVLYRGAAMSFGSELLGGPVPAAIAAVAVFTLAHYRWQAPHLVNVALAGSALMALYLYTGDLFACIVAHFVVDAAGMLLLPISLRRRTETP